MPLFKAQTGDVLNVVQHEKGVLKRGRPEMRLSSNIWTTPVLNGGRPQRLRQSCPHLALTFSPPDVCGRTFQHLPV